MSNMQITPFAFKLIQIILFVYIMSQGRVVQIIGPALDVAFMITDLFKHVSFHIFL